MVRLEIVESWYFPSHRQRNSLPFPNAGEACEAVSAMATLMQSERMTHQTSQRLKVFIAAPMSGFASDADYALHRDVVNATCEALEHDGLEPYFAGRNISSASQFTQASEAFRQDFTALQSTDLFVLYYPLPVRSSVLVEAGMAIGMGKPCLFAANKVSDLVYLLRSASEAGDQRGVPPIHIKEFEPGKADANALIAEVKSALTLFAINGNKRKRTA